MLPDGYNFRPLLLDGTSGYMLHSLTGKRQYFTVLNDAGE
jgi:hypothetical protein